MSDRIDLLWIGASRPPHWTAGRTIVAEATNPGLSRTIELELKRTGADAWLFWADRLGSPDSNRVMEALRSPGDVWHAGLTLGTGGLPSTIDFVEPTWMFNRDPDPSIEATSWRLSLEACLARVDVLRRLGGTRAEFQTLAGAGLELGHRWIARGALLRHMPRLVAVEADEGGRPSSEDEMRFIYYRYGRFWLRWSLLRLVMMGRLGPLRAAAIRRRLEGAVIPDDPPPLRQDWAPHRNLQSTGSQTVTVLIPTVDRYPYLQKLLEQFRAQTIRPLEIIVVDQTVASNRRADLYENFSDLPLRVIYLDRAGQCSSRNTGLQTARGDYVLFVDDDDEVPADLVEKHLRSLAHFRCDVSSGVAEEVGAGPLPPAFRLIRSSDVFPTNNSMIVKDSLLRSGLFDLAYDRGSRADGDLGMRLYLSGCHMVLNSTIQVLHHHAPSGGLRKHGARIITYASSRSKLLQRHLPSVTELYMARRYFTREQAKEALLLRIVTTFAARGGLLKRALKILASVILLPDTVAVVFRRRRRARELLARGPWIDKLTVPAQIESQGVEPRSGWQP